MDDRIIGQPDNANFMAWVLRLLEKSPFSIGDQMNTL